MTPTVRIRQLATDDSGQDLLEYAMLAGLIAMMCVAAATSFGGSMANYWADLATKVTRFAS